MRVWMIVLGGALVGACASDSEDPQPAPGTDVGANTPAPAQSNAPKGGGGQKETPPAQPKNDCKLAAMTGVEDIAPSFVMYAFPNEIPMTMKGGTLAGKYVGVGAKVYLPSAAAGLVFPEQSTGTMNAWAVFDGTNYHLKLKGSFTLGSVQGPLSQDVDNESQGGFTVDSENIALDHACDTDTPQAADYSFTDDGSGKAMIVVKMQTPYGDTYLQLEATKM